MADADLSIVLYLDEDNVMTHTRNTIPSQAA